MADVLGIDPGIAGAAAIIRATPGSSVVQIIDVIDLPTMGDDSKREINARALFDWIDTSWVASSGIRPSHAVIENVHAMPSIPDAMGVRRGMGAASAFKFGMSVGAIRAAVACAGIPLTLVVPTVWKKFYGLKGGDKEASRQLVLQKFPNDAARFARKADHQRAESVLLAWWAIRVGRLE